MIHFWRSLHIFVIISLLFSTFGRASASAPIASVDQAHIQTFLTALVPQDKVSVGNTFACAVTNTGGVKCWGNNYYGQVGDGTTIHRSRPVDVIGLASGVIGVSAGDYHACALMDTGDLKCWGRNNEGQLGDGTQLDHLTPVDVINLGSDADAISANYEHSCAHLTTGGVKCWGSNSSGQIGDGTLNQRLTPTDVTGLSTGVSSITTGQFHSCALLNSGEVRCWGNNSWGQIGDGTNIRRLIPTNVINLQSDISAISSDSLHTCVALVSGGGKCWGDNIFGKLGDGTTINRNAPVDILNISSTIISLSAGHSHSCAVLSTGGAKCWGDNRYGQIGDGTITQRLSAVDVSGLNSGVIKISSGNGSSCVVMSTGGVKCWGYNYYGGVGDGSFIHRYTPVDVIGLNTGIQTDLAVQDVWWSPSPPTAMTGTTLYIEVRNVGAQTYVPVKGTYALGVKLTDAEHPDQVWQYRFNDAVQIPQLAPNQTIVISHTNFWFTREQVDHIEMTLYPDDPDWNMTNNSLGSVITIEPPEDSILACLSVFLSSVFFTLNLFAVDVGAVAKISADFTLTLVKIGAAQTNEKMWEAVTSFVVNSAITLGKYVFQAPVRIVITFIVSAYNAFYSSLECGSALADAIIRINDDMNARGYSYNTIVVESPVNVLIEDTSGNRVGINDAGQIYKEILDSDVVVYETDHKVILYPGEDTGLIRMYGTGSGYANFRLALAQGDRTTANIDYIDVMVTTNSYAYLDPDDPDHRLVMDYNGDGVVDAWYRPYRYETVTGYPINLPAICK